MSSFKLDIKSDPKQSGSDLINIEGQKARCYTRILAFLLVSVIPNWYMVKSKTLKNTTRILISPKVHFSFSGLTLKKLIVKHTYYGSLS